VARHEEAPRGPARAPRGGALSPRDWPYERRRHPLLSPEKFRARLQRHSFFALGVLAASLVAGILGYHFIARLAWIDAALNAAMILSGMGPVDALTTPGAKLFATAYSLFSGIVFLAVAGIIFAPLAHRMLHKFHLDDE
jgi:hypothetical protein